MNLIEIQFNSIMINLCGYLQINTIYIKSKIFHKTNKPFMYRIKLFGPNQGFPSFQKFFKKELQYKHNHIKTIWSQSRVSIISKVFCGIQEIKLSSFQLRNLR